MYCLSENDIKIKIDEIGDVSSCKADIIYDPENLCGEEFKRMLFIEIESAVSKLNILLYCSFLGNYEYCSVLHDRHLILAKYNTVYKIDVFTGEMQYISIPDMAGAFRLYLLDDGYLIHGEMKIAKLSFSFEILWDFFGADIFASFDGEECCKISGDKIELLDFSGNRYTIPLTPELKEKERQH